MLGNPPAAARFIFGLLKRRFSLTLACWVSNTRLDYYGQCPGYQWQCRWGWHDWGVWSMWRWSYQGDNRVNSQLGKLLFSPEILPIHVTPAFVIRSTFCEFVFGVKNSDALHVKISIKKMQKCTTVQRSEYNRPFNLMFSRKANPFPSFLFSNDWCWYQRSTAVKMSSTTAATATQLAAHMAGTHAGDDDAGRQQRTTPV